MSKLTAAGSVIASGSSTKQITVWMVGRKDPISVPVEELQAGGDTGAWSPNGAMFASFRSGGPNQSVTIYDLVSRRVVGLFALSEPDRGSAFYTSGAKFSPDGRTLAVPTNHGLFLAEAMTAKILRVLRERRSMEGRVEFTPDGSAVLIVEAPTQDLVLLDVTNGSVLARAAGGDDMRSELTIGFPPDGDYLVTIADRARLMLRNAKTLARVGEIAAPVNNLSTGAISLVNRIIATGGQDGKLRLWDMRRREELVAIDLAAGMVRNIAFTPDGTNVRFAANDLVGELDLHA
jgi:WD40 repeat protein